MNQGEGCFEFLKESGKTILFFIVALIVLGIGGYLLFELLHGGVESVKLAPGKTQCKDYVMLYNGNLAGDIELVSGSMELIAKSQKSSSKLTSAPKGLSYTFTPKVEETIYKDKQTGMETSRSYKITYRYCFTASQTAEVGNYDVRAEITFYTTSVQISSGVIRIPYKVEIAK